MPKQDVIPIRGYLIHLTHYDPLWYRRKPRENPIDLDLALEIIDSIAELGFNLLIIDCADAVRYKSHPELIRRYSVSAATLRRLVMRAQVNDIEIVPKLNFSQSRYYKHNRWCRPYDKHFDSDAYWRIAFELIDELIHICQPKRYFHIGMDEDHERTIPQYIKAILRLRYGLKQRGLRALIWNDSPHRGFAKVHAKKSLAAERKIPRDIVQIIWDYGKVPPRHIRRLVDEGFEVWGAPGWTAQHAFNWKQAILRYGGKGLIMTRWIPCQRRNRSKLLQLIGTTGPIFSAKYMSAAEPV
jgi:hypothetical protein